MTNTSTKFIAAFGLVAGLGMAAALPMVTHAEPLTADTTITATVNESIAIATTTPTIAIELGVNDLQTATGNFIVSTNHVGYNVTVQGTAASGTATALTKDSSNSIPYAASVAKGTSGWNLNVTNGEGTPTSITDPAPAATKATASALAGDTYNVTYSVATASNQVQGAYTGKVTYTASIN